MAATTRELALRVVVEDVNTGQVVMSSYTRINRLGAILRPTTVFEVLKETAKNIIAHPGVAAQLTRWHKGEDIPHRKGATE